MEEEQPQLEQQIETPLVGEPKMGLHAYRIPILDVSAFDTIGTVVGGVVLAKMFDWSPTKTVAGLFALSVPLHIYFKKDTKIVETIKKYSE